MIIFGIEIYSVLYKFYIYARKSKDVISYFKKYTKEENMYKAKAIEYAKKVFEAYYVDRNLYGLKDIIAKDVKMFGVDLLYNFKNRDELMEYINELKEETVVVTSILEENYFPLEIGNEIAVICEIKIKTPHQNGVVYIRATFIFKQDEGELKIYHMHFSMPEYHTSFIFKSRIVERMKNAEEFYKAMPGGVVKVDTSAGNYEIIDSNKEFYELAGFSKEEFEKNGGNSFLFPIHKEDLDEVVSKLKENENADEKFTIKYRIVKKDGSIAWMLANIVCDNIAQMKRGLYCVIIDITSECYAQARLSFEKERYRMISEISRNINFEYDIDTDILCFERTDNFITTPKILCNFKERLYKPGIVHEDDSIVFDEIFDEIINKKKDYLVKEARIYDENKKPSWYSITLKRYYSKELSCDKIIGSLVDIDKQKREKETLILNASLDPLTKLLNKQSTQQKILEYLESSENGSPGALIVIDIDNFKTINDTLGHLFGDAIIKEIALRLRVLFRSTDIIGRIGGDEFVVFMKDVYSNEIIFEKAKLLCERIEASYENESIGISASVGIAITSQKMNNFKELFKAADTALYFAKSQGKNQYRMYNDTILRQNFKVEERCLDSNFSSSVSYNDTCIKIFELLCQSSELENDIKDALGIMLKFFDAGRVYIMEINSTCKCLYQKCSKNTGSGAKIVEEMFTLEKDKMLASFNMDGIFYCDDFLKADNVWKETLEQANAESSLQYMISYKDNKKIIFCIDDCRSKRLWKKTEIDALIIMSKIINEFLMKIL